LSLSPIRAPAHNDAETASSSTWRMPRVAAGTVCQAGEARISPWPRHPSAVEAQHLETVLSTCFPRKLSRISRSSTGEVGDEFAAKVKDHRRPAFNHRLRGAALDGIISAVPRAACSWASPTAQARLRTSAYHLASWWTGTAPSTSTASTTASVGWRR
jgi:hypothetical protein